MSDANPAPAPERSLAAPIQTSAFNSRDWLARLAIAVLLAGSLGLIWWNLTVVLTPRQRQAREIASRVARLSAEVDDLERKWTPEKTKDIEAKYVQLPSHVLAGPAALEAWLAELDQQDAPLGLDVKSELGEALPRGADKKLAVIPVTLSVSVLPPASTPGLGSSPYQRILQLTQSLTSQSERADLMEVTLTGGPKSITSAMLVLDVWASEGRPQ